MLLRLTWDKILKTLESIRVLLEQNTIVSPYNDGDKENVEDCASNNVLPHRKPFTSVRFRGPIVIRLSWISNVCESNEE